MKTICIPGDLHRELMQLKLQNGNKNTAELIRELLFEYRQRKFLEASNLFKKKLKERNMSFSELLRKSRRIREEISDEWF